ncbi:O-antigen ligase family protein [Candidatus Woesebacteria bacterium]|nr:O-antigen ligase family protein [Candidatus Woesebacteria bacterium]
MKSKITEYIDSLIFLLLLLSAFVTPLIFLGLTSDYYEMPKLIFLVSITLILYILWTTSWFLKGKISIKRTPLDIPLLTVLVVVLVSTFSGSSKYISIYGALPEVHGSAISWVTYILLYFVASSNIKDNNYGKIFLQVLVGSSSLVAVISILSFFGVFLPFEMARSVNFTTTGSTFSTVSLLLMLLPLTFISTLKQNKFLPQPLAMILSLIFSMAIVLIGSNTVYLIFFVIFGSSIFLARKELNITSLAMVFTPFALSVLTLMLLLIPFSGNRLNENRFHFPREVRLPRDISWKISFSTMKDSPLLGTGPATYLYNFTQYKPIEFNRFDFWNFDFGRASNEYFQIIGELGIAGLLSTVYVYCVIFLNSKKNFFELKTKKDGDLSVIISALKLTGFVAIFLTFIHYSTLISVVFTLLLMAIYFFYQRLDEGEDNDFSIGIKVRHKGNKRINLLPGAVFVLTIALVSYIGNELYKAVTADYYHRLALSQADRDGAKTYEYLQKAEKLNPHIDLYRVDMAQTNFALANVLATQKGPTPANSEGTLTDQDRQTIQTLITQAINEARVATTLAPRSSRNWEVLAGIYKNIAGVAENSLAFSLDAYGRAIEVDPFNPDLRLNVGLIYYSAGNYDQAVGFFTDSVDLKPDYVSGYYNLALALKENGELGNAKDAAEQVVSLIRNNLTSEERERTSELLKEAWVQDYTAATKLLNQIEDKIESETLQEDVGLNDPNLPEINVPGLENPPETTAPDSVEETKNPDTD